MQRLQAFKYEVQPTGELKRNRRRYAGACRNHTMVCIEDVKVRNMSKSLAGSVEQPGKQVRANSAVGISFLPGLETSERDGGEDVKNQIGAVGRSVRATAVAPCLYTHQADGSYELIGVTFGASNVDEVHEEPRYAKWAKLDAVLIDSVTTVLARKQSCVPEKLINLTVDTRRDMLNKSGQTLEEMKTLMQAKPEVQNELVGRIRQKERIRPLLLGSSKRHSRVWPKHNII